MIKPMLCKDVGGKPPQVPCEPGYVLEAKFDGWRWLIEKTEDGMRYYSGRNSKELSKDQVALERINAVLDFLPPGTVLDSELIAEGIENGVGSVLAQTPRGRQGRLHAYVFDVLRVDGTDVMQLMWHQRRELFLDKIAEELEYPVTAVPYVDAPPDEQQATHERWLDLGMEGSIAKKKTSTYRPGSRSNDWLKIKPQETTEAVVIGYEMGKGESNGHLAAALEIRLLDTDVETSCAKESTVEEAEAMIGKICEIRHHGFQSSGAVRHPIFKRWRPDRDKEDE